MKKILSIFIVLLFTFGSLALAYSPYAPHYYHGDHRVYHYRDHGWWLGGALVTGLAIGAIIDSPPPMISVMYVNGYPYYYDGRYYYQAVDGGYMVIPTPQPTPVVHSVVEIPGDFTKVQFKGETFYVHGPFWYIYTPKGLLRVSEPT